MPVSRNTCLGKDDQRQVDLVFALHLLSHRNIPGAELGSTEWMVRVDPGDCVCRRRPDMDVRRLGVRCVPSDSSWPAGSLNEMIVSVMHHDRRGRTAQEAAGFQIGQGGTLVVQRRKQDAGEAIDILVKELLEVDSYRLLPGESVHQIGCCANLRLRASGG